MDISEWAVTNAVNNAAASAMGINPGSYILVWVL